jgi:UDP-glucose-4-epimerase GalE
MASEGRLMVPILVTGGAGFIGSLTCKLLARSGFAPITYDNLSTGHAWATHGRRLIVSDLADKDTLCDVMREFRVQAVVHFAASAYVGESILRPREYFQNNVVNTLNLLDAMLDAGVRRVVFSSTCATYGVAESLPINEDHTQIPCNPYGDSKLFVEKTLAWYERAYGISSVILRYFNAAGADLEGELGEEHHPETHLIPLAIFAAMKRRPSFNVFGSDYQTPDGTAIRDFIHVSDLARAHVLACRHLVESRPSSVFNLGSGREHSVLDVIRTVESITRSRVPVQSGPRRKGDAPALVADASRAERVLGWRAENSGLSSIVESAYRWFSSDFSAARATQLAASAPQTRDAAVGAD